MQALSASFFTAFFMAGGVEELFKFLAIIITLKSSLLFLSYLKTRSKRGEYQCLKSTLNS